MILACIITYNPELLRLDNNINSIYKQVHKLIIVDNGSYNIESIKELSLKYNCLVLSNSTNKGIAYALNQGLNYCIDNDYKWILTLDQDSVVEKNMILKFLNFLQNKKDDNIGVIGPKIVDRNIHIKGELLTENKYTKKLTVITSGSLINVKFANEIGGFKDELFIDGVDFEFCLNMNANNYSVFQVNDAILYHELGNIKLRKFFGRDVITTNHSALRRYYYFRNKFYIYKKYFKLYPRWVIKNILSSIKTFLLIIIFEKYKLKKIKFSLLGIKDGIFNKYENNINLK